MSSGDQNFFTYDQDAGVLKLNRNKFPEGTLEQITELIDQNPEEMIVDFGGLYFPPLKGVKGVEYLSPEEMIVEREEASFPEEDYSEKRTLWQRIRPYLGMR
jgi:hypothetical protein